MSDPSPSSNPFVDPDDTQVPMADSTSIRSTRGHDLLEATLAVGRNASLTLGTDSLIVLDEAFQKRDRRNCFGLLNTGSASTRAIPFYNILWAELSDLEITIHYAKIASKHVVRAAYMHYTIDKSDTERIERWISRLLDKAYGQAQRQKRAKVLVNPHAGKGSAEKWYYRDVQPILAAARCEIDLVKTKHGGEAVGICEHIDIEQYDVIVACSGDGLAHEVFNGLGRRTDAKRALEKIAVAHVPCGSGNAMSCNTSGTDSPSLAALAIVKGLPTPLDLISVTQGETRTLSFLSQAVGIVAESDLGTENLRWMGPMRFTYGFLVRLIGQKVYPCDLAMKVVMEDKAEIREHYDREVVNFTPASERRGDLGLVDDDASERSGTEHSLPSLRYGTVNDKVPEDWQIVPHDTLANFYCGNMGYMASDALFFSPALPNDGLMDMVTINGNISRLSSLNLMLQINNGHFFDNPFVKYRKVLAYRLIPKHQDDGYISIDGERVPFAPFQCEVHRGLGTVLTKSGRMYEAPGPLGCAKKND